MDIRHFFAKLTLLTAAMIAGVSCVALAGSEQSGSAPNYQSASLPRGTIVQQFSSQVPPTSIVRPDYIIGPDDVIAVDVFQIPDLSRTVQVDADGKVQLPLLGPVQAASRSIAQLSEQIAAAYGARYVRDPKVIVSVKDSASQKVTVNGAVIQPGIYPVTNSTTLMQAIAMARGPDMKLASDRVAVFRTVGQHRTEATFDISAIREGKIEDPQLHGGDIVIVDTSGVRRFLQDISPIAPFVSLGALF